LQKIYSWKFVKNIFYIKKRNLLIPRPPKRTPKLLEKPSSALKKEHSALQNMKILNFFLFVWVIFALLDPDPNPAPATQITAVEPIAGVL
jgi:hypothetical protein